jgi:methyltransferase
MSQPILIVVSSLLAILLMMLAELRVSLAHERELFRAGAIEAPDPVYATMRWAYPATFVAMAIEGLVTASPPGPLTIAGLAVFAAGKALKVWAIASLGTRWTYRVLVIPSAPLVTRGPYRFMRHPNYAGVIGELVGMALLVQAPVTGVLSVIGFGYLLRLRIRTEEQALGLQR